MSITATATIANDVNFTLIRTGSNAQQETGKLSYSRSLESGSDSLQINYGVISSGTLPSGGKQYFDFRALEKDFLEATANIQFSKIKSIVIENDETVYGWDINIYATGTTPLSEIFNGGTGNLLIKPYAVYQYSDPISGVTVDSSNKELILEDVSGSGADWRMVVVGVTG